MTGLCDIDALVPIPVKTFPATLQELQKIARTKTDGFRKEKLKSVSDVCLTSI